MAMGKQLRYFKILLGENFDEAFEAYHEKIKGMKFAGRMSKIYGKYENVPEGIKFKKVPGTGEKSAYYHENPQLGPESIARAEWQINNGEGEWYFLGYYHALEKVNEKLSTKC